ncbi:Very-long-chain 3-oxoacyl-CoA synthase [Bertholletia excelsa]
MGLHVVLPLHLHLPLRRPLPHPPPLSLPPPPEQETSPSRSPPRPPQPRYGPHLRHNIRRNPPLCRGRDPRHPMVLAPLQDSLSVAPLLPNRNPPSGRVFFWSYAFYLSRFLHTFRTFLAILRRRNPSFLLFNHSILIVMSFLWLEFSQSFQVLAILLTTCVYAFVYGYRFWTSIGLPSACFPFVESCQIVLLGCNILCHVGVLLLHFMNGGCNGIGAWVCNSVLNGAILLLFLNFHLRLHLRKRKGGEITATAEAEIDGVKDKDI